MKNAKRRTKTNSTPAKTAGAQHRRGSLKTPAIREGLQTGHVVLGAVASLIALFAVYWPALDAPFVFDDQYLPFHNPAFERAPLMTWLFGVRPTLMLSYWINYQISATQTTSHHVFNLLFHYGAGILIFFVVRKIIGLANVKDWQQNLIAAFSAGVFLFHPLQTEAVAYVAGRSENLSVFFFYAAFAAFLYRDSEAISFPRTILVLALFGLAVTSKEHTVMLPFLLLLTDYFWNPGFSFQGIKRNWRLYAPIVLAGGAGFAFVFSTLMKANTAGFSVEGLPWYLYFATQCKAIWIYIRMFLFPFGQNADHDYQVVESFADPMVIAGLAGLIAIVAAAWIFRRRFSLAAYGLFTFLLLLAPTSSFVPIKDALVERRVYLPMLGLLLIVAELARRWKTTPKNFAVAAGVVLVAFSFLSTERAKVWAGPLELWEDSVAQNPENWRANFQLAYAYYAEQHCSAAAEQYGRTAELTEVDHRLLVDWALAEDCAGKPDAAIAKLKEAVALDDTAHVYTQMAVIYGRQGKYEEALEVLDEAEKKQRYFPLTFFYRGNVYSSMGRWAEAVDAYRMAVTLDENMDAASRGLARALDRLRQTQ
jgi:protein O-mannosyl-transferase